MHPRFSFKAWDTLDQGISCVSSNLKWYYEEIHTKTSWSNYFYNLRFSTESLITQLTCFPLSWRESRFYSSSFNYQIIKNEIK